MDRELESNIHWYRKGNEFDWSKWSTPGSEAKPKTTAVSIEEFEEWYRRRKSIKDSTWKQHWPIYLDSLHPNCEVTEAAIYQVVMNTAQNSRDRAVGCWVSRSSDNYCSREATTHFASQAMEDGAADAEIISCQHLLVEGRFNLDTSRYPEFGYLDEDRNGIACERGVPGDGNWR